MTNLWPPPPPMDPDEAAEKLAALREEFAGRWHIWRSQLTGGQPWGWYASIRHPAAGVDQTVSAPGPAELRAALIEQRRLAERRPHLL